MTNGISPFDTQGQGLLTEGVSQRPAGAAGLLDVTIAGVMPDVESKISYYSQEMGIPRNRFSVRDGQIVYRTDRGNLQAVEPGFTRQFLTGLGPTLPAIGGIGGAIVGSGLGPAGTAAGGMTGAAGMQALREAIAGTALTPSGGRRIATEAAIDLGAGVVGALVGKGVSRALATQAANDFKRAMGQTGSDIATALRGTLSRLNAQYGTNIVLTPAEVTRSAELIAQQTALASDPRSAQQMAEFYAARGQEAGKAARGFIEDISPVADRDVAGQQLVDVAGEAIALTRAERSAAARPAYDDAFTVKVTDEQGEVIATNPRMVDISAFDQELNKLVVAYPMLKTQLSKIKSAYKNQTEQSLEFVQNNIKEALDDVISTMKNRKPKAAQKAGELQRSLLKSLDEQVPQYANARAVWGDLSDPVTAVQGGSLAAIANKKPKDFYDVGRLFLTKDSPASIARAREQIMKVDGGEEKWNAALRGALESVWEQSSRQFKSGVGRPEMLEGQAAISFWATMKGNKAQLSRLKAAMTPDQFKALNNLLDVFEATGRAYNYNSTTVAQQMGRDALEQSGVGAGTLLPYVTAPYRVFGASSDAIARGVRNKNLDTLVDVITRSDSVEELMKIQKGQGGFFNPRNVSIASRALVGTARLVGGMGIGYRDMPESPSDVLPINGNSGQNKGFISPFD